MREDAHLLRYVKGGCQMGGGRKALCSRATGTRVRGNVLEWHQGDCRDWRHGIPLLPRAVSAAWGF